jgi:polyhydroxyalkanoate synthesis regulator phasin
MSTLTNAVFTKEQQEKAQQLVDSWPGINDDDAKEPTDLYMPDKQTQQRIKRQLQQRRLRAMELDEGYRKECERIIADAKAGAEHDRHDR